jgi:hypothetical protein
VESCKLRYFNSFEFLTIRPAIGPIRAAVLLSSKPGPFQEFYAALLAKGMRPEMARLTLARKIATIVLIVKYRWPKFRLLAVAHVQITLFLERMRFWRGTADAHGQRAACQP